MRHRILPSICHSQRKGTAARHGRLDLVSCHEQHHCPEHIVLQESCSFRKRCVLNSRVPEIPVRHCPVACGQWPSLYSFTGSICSSKTWPVNRAIATPTQ